MPIDGSSSSSSFGLAISARPIASICCSPPDIVPAFWRSRSLSRGNSSNTRSHVARRRRRRGAGRRPGRGSRARVMRWKQCRPSGDCEMPSRTMSWGGGLADLACRRSGSSPAAAASGPEIERSVVDLPAPFEPISVTISPSSTVERDALERLDVAVVGVDVVELEQRHRQPPCFAEVGLDHALVRRGSPPAGPRRSSRRGRAR